MRASGAGPEDDQASEQGPVGATVERVCGQTDGITSEWNPSFASGSPLPGVIIRTPTSASTTQHGVANGLYKHGLCKPSEIWPRLQKRPIILRPTYLAAWQWWLFARGRTPLWRAAPHCRDPLLEGARAASMSGFPLNATFLLGAASPGPPDL